MVGSEDIMYLIYKDVIMVGLFEWLINTPAVARLFPSN